MKSRPRPRPWPGRSPRRTRGPRISDTLAGGGHSTAQTSPRLDRPALDPPGASSDRTSDRARPANWEPAVSGEVYCSLGVCWPDSAAGTAGTVSVPGVRAGPTTTRIVAVKTARMRPPGVQPADDVGEPVQGQVTAAVPLAEAQRGDHACVLRSPLACCR